MNLKKIPIDKIQPCGHYIYVQLIEVEETSAGGIVMTSKHRDREQDGMPLAKVLSIGNTAYLNHSSGINTAKEWGFKVGDYVLIHPFDYRKIQCDTDNVVSVLDFNVFGKADINEEDLNG